MPVMTEEPRTQTESSGGGGGGRPPRTRNALSDAIPPGNPVPPSSTPSAAVSISSVAVVLGWMAYHAIKWLSQLLAG
ncbi:MAG: hypothetical protein Q8M66_03790 [Actinomycetota bacterium]|nr:hypothetical protein [Actinomycetota bacterium]MDZ4178608.1 hypothetical protein [Coriobacteriia bacterium]